MSINVISLHAKILNIAKEKNTDFQELINHLAAEQFLYRLSISPFTESFIFKGGSLLTYLIDSDRKTKDLDFSVKQASHKGVDVANIIESVLKIPVDDGFEWNEIKWKQLNHPDMDEPGIRLTCPFLLGRMKGVVRIDIAFGDVVDSVKLSLQRIKYKGESFFDAPLSLSVYPPETIFSEKLQIAVNKGSQNTRMKDYYDLFKLCDHKLDPIKLKNCITNTFKKRKMKPIFQLNFDKTELQRLQTYWEHFILRDKIKTAPPLIQNVIIKINNFVKILYGS
ncbi:MAG: nucleotidyl transferase AbiEii/AbiGii toxin family protein [Deltaproteobacteria bacterium]|nr:nucleotidyl transferase AbiEii/AbiGii toxin family protein [Deltaproteobacteria bacterium]